MKFALYVVFLNGIIADNDMMYSVKAEEEVVGYSLITEGDLIGYSNVIWRAPNKDETFLGGFVADAVRAQIGSSSIAIISDTGIVSDWIPSGAEGNEITVQLVQGSLRGDRLVRAELSNRNLKTILEQQWQTEEEEMTHQLQVSGIRYEYDTTRPLGDRIVNITSVNNHHSMTSTEYDTIWDWPNYNQAIVTTSSLINGGDGFSAFPELAQNIVETQVLDYTTVIDHARQIAYDGGREYEIEPADTERGINIALDRTSSFTYSMVANEKSMLVSDVTFTWSSTEHIEARFKVSLDSGIMWIWLDQEEVSPDHPVSANKMYYNFGHWNNRHYYSIATDIYDNSPLPRGFKGEFEDRDLFPETYARRQISTTTDTTGTTTGPPGTTEGPGDGSGTASNLCLGFTVLLLSSSWVF